ncbi:Small ribosomal subunit biogenesis GTPase RsgA [Planctomycetales bacterium 10988]|nr:Small ribosomal subunit biogenesis GTPase RsgA [Planctomycetales bacterium 10988]
MELRKNQQTRTRKNDLTRHYEGDQLDADMVHQERLSGKGKLTRKRTVISETRSDADGDQEVIVVDESLCRPGRVLRTQGLHSIVLSKDGERFQCATRKLLKDLSSGQRQAVSTGDRVLFRLVNEQEGMIERIEPRRRVLSRTSKGRQHVLVANVDQMLIIASVAEPYLKPNLVDRFLISAEQGKLPAIICLNKIDLVDPADLQPLIGLYSQLGHRVIPVSAKDGTNVDYLKRNLTGKETVVAGQSGVGKSSLLNAIEPSLTLREGAVSEENQKGKHTTTAAEMYPLAGGGYVVDTPGIRQFELWDVIREEIPAFFRDIRPFINHCRFPDCTHTHEEDCAVKDAVADHLLDARRYESYLHLFEGDAV